MGGEREGNIHSIAFNPLWNTKRGGRGGEGRNIDLPPPILAGLIVRKLKPGNMGL